MTLNIIQGGHDDYKFNSKGALDSKVRIYYIYKGFSELEYMWLVDLCSRWYVEQGV